MRIAKTFLSLALVANVAVASSWFSNAGACLISPLSIEIY
jgi:hypothetical protein